MDAERTSVNELIGFKITRVVIDGYGVQLFGRKGRGNEKLIGSSSNWQQCFFDGDGNLFAEIS